MEKRKYAAQLDNIYFLPCIGPSLRWATAHLAPGEVPDHVRHLLISLHRMEAFDRIWVSWPQYSRKRFSDNPGEDPAA